MGRIIQTKKKRPFYRTLFVYVLKRNNLFDHQDSADTNPFNHLPFTICYCLVMCLSSQRITIPIYGQSLGKTLLPCLSIG
jgi:hypothetical protein